MRFYITHHAATTKNEQCLANLNSVIYTINAKNSVKDWNTGILERFTINADVPVNKIGTLPKQLKVWLGAKVMLLTNVDNADRVINGLGGQTILMQGM